MAATRKKLTKLPSPRKAEADVENVVYLGVRIPLHLRIALKTTAAQQQLSLSDLVTQTLTEWLERDGR